MNSNEQDLSKITLDKEINSLSKALYLESPDLWIEFQGKMNDNIFDEMVLFFATKYNYLSIVKYVVDNNIVNLDTPSKNATYPNIKKHLLAVALQYNNTNVYDYFKNGLTSIVTDDCKNAKTESLCSTKELNHNINSYIPEYICSHCNSNIFASGYKLYENVIYKFSNAEKKIIESSRNSTDTITCCNCNKIINNITFKELENLSLIQNCEKCNSNLLNCGILDKSKMTFDKNLNKFISTANTYHCANCDNAINKSQQEYFNL